MVQRTSPTVQKLEDVDISLSLNSTWNEPPALGVLWPGSPPTNLGEAGYADSPYSRLVFTISLGDAEARRSIPPICLLPLRASASPWQSFYRHDRFIFNTTPAKIAEKKVNILGRGRGRNRSPRTIAHHAEDSFEKSGPVGLKVAADLRVAVVRCRWVVTPKPGLNAAGYTASPPIAPSNRSISARHGSPI